MSLNFPRRRLALLLIPACLALAACGGGEEKPAAEPDTRVVVPTATATPEIASPFETVEGYMLSANIRRVVVLTQEGRETYYVQPGSGERVGIDHLASHAGLTDIAFFVEYEEINGKPYIRSAREIAPPFPYDDPGAGQ